MKDMNQVFFLVFVPIVFLYSGLTKTRVYFSVGNKDSGFDGTVVVVNSPLYRCGDRGGIGILSVPLQQERIRIRERIL